jgi:hypothetical protein
MKIPFSKRGVKVSSSVFVRDMADVQMRRDRTPARNDNESTNTLDRMPLSSERMLRMDQGCSSTAKNTSLSTLPK